MQPTENRLRRGRVFSGARGGLHHVYHACDSTDEIFAPYSCFVYVFVELSVSSIVSHQWL